MNSVYFNMPLDQPRTAWEFLYMIGSMSQDNPEFFLRNTERLAIGGTDRVAVLTQNSVRPACVVIRDELLGTIILLAGTQGALHVAQLVNGWLSPGGSIRASGACPAFENAALDILGNLPPGLIDNTNVVRIFGYSYGGATGQVIADELANNLRNPLVSCVSFASPRPGNTDFQRRMSRIPNVRWFADDDPVRFMPPHVPEVPSALYFLQPALWEGMDTQVQCPRGMQIEANGNITVTEGNPTRLHAVIPSIIRWITDDQGFQSILHSRESYMSRFVRAIELEPPVIIPPGPVQPEQPVRINVGEAAHWEAEAEADVIAAPSLALPAGQPVTLNRIPQVSPLRYKRKKQGRIWTVQLAGVVVAIGPGKKRAGQLARHFNRTAVVTP